MCTLHTQAAFYVVLRANHLTFDLTRNLPIKVEAPVYLHQHALTGKFQPHVKSPMISICTIQVAFCLGRERLTFDLAFICDMSPFLYIISNVLLLVLLFFVCIHLWRFLYMHSIFFLFNLHLCVMIMMIQILILILILIILLILI